MKPLTESQKRAILALSGGGFLVRHESPGILASIRSLRLHRPDLAERVAAGVGWDDIRLTPAGIAARARLVEENS